MRFFRRPVPAVEFLCHKEDVGIIAEPFPARKFMPDWFRALAPKIDNLDKIQNSTIKRCAPFLDSLITGWIIPLAADVEIVTNDDASGVSYKWNYSRPLIENHTPEQVAGHPSLPKPPMKFLNYWLIKAPKGYDILFVPPLNRPDPRFTCFSGLVNMDRYFEFINFPFFFNQPNFTGILKKGTPLVQVIPIRREAFLSVKREITAEEIQQVESLRRKRSTHESLYRDELWVRK